MSWQVRATAISLPDLVPIPVRWRSYCRLRILWSILLVPNCIELFEASASQADGQGDDVVRLTVEQDTVAIRKRGEQFPAAVSGSFVRLGDVEFYTLVVRDVTARKEVDRLRNEFVATVSHELRTPLAAVMGFLETVLSQRSGPLNEIQIRHLGLSYTAAQRLNRHVEELLTVSKIQQEQLRLNRNDFNPAFDRRWSRWWGSSTYSVNAARAPRNNPRMAALFPRRLSRIRTRVSR